MSSRKPNTTPALLACLLLGGCASADALVQPGDQPGVRTEADRPVAREVQAFPARTASVEDVVLAVPVAGSMRGPGRCDAPLELGGQTRVGLHWSGPEGRAVRLVSANFDGEGRLRSYNDMRGGATNMHTIDSEPGTAIVLTFGQDIALVRNHGPGAGEAFMLSLEDALDAPELDVPRRWIEELRERCAGDGHGR